MPRGFPVLFVLATLGVAQPPARLPVFAGDASIHLMVDIDGTVKSWGEGVYLSLGDGPKRKGVVISQPRPVAGLGKATSIVFGAKHVLVLMQDGTVMAWGENNGCEVGNTELVPRGRVPCDSPNSANTPVIVTGLSGVVQVAASAGSSGALLRDGSVMLWGALPGPLSAEGYASVRRAVAPERMEGLTNITQISLGFEHGLALRQDGVILAWGANKEGTIGDGTRDPRLLPVPVKGITSAVWVAAGLNMSAAVLADGTVRTWGENVNGQLGDPVTNPIDPARNYRLVPYQVPGIANAKSIQIGLGPVIAHLKDGTLRGWGEGYYGGLGNGSSDDFFTRPQIPRGLGPVLAHYFLTRGSLAVRADGTVMGWGRLDMNTPSGFQRNAVYPVVVFPAGTPR